MRLFPLIATAALSLPLASLYGQQPSLSPSFSSSSVPMQLVSDAAEGGSAVAAPISGSNSVLNPPGTRVRPFSAVGVGVKVGVLGIGFEAATPVARKFNVRGGANFFSYTDNFSSDGINYGGNLHFRSVEASLDYFPWAKGFHISPGALLYNGNQITGNLNVPAGQTFTLNDMTYTSSPTDPVTGNGSLTFAKAAPKITVGWGNLVPRSGRHFSVPFEVGFAYAGDPKVVMNLAGTACYDQQGQYYCSDVQTNADIQSNLAAQRQKIVNDVSPARFFPILSAGFAYSF